MSLPKLLITRRVYDPVLDSLSGAFDIQHNQDKDEPLTKPDLMQKLADKDYLLSTVVDRIDEEVLAAAPGLKCIASGAVGTNNIDLKACADRGIAVTNTPDVLTETTADFAWALLMATARRLTEAEQYLRQGQWKGWSFDQLTGVDVYGSTLGILGMGRIGSAIARRAQGFGMTVLYHNRRPASDEARARYVEKDVLFKESDFVVLVVPYSPQTHHIVAAKELALMKTSACLVNIARGGVVDDKALVQALQSGSIRAAGLDVFEGEPALDPGFLPLSNVVLTPHIASSTRATRGAMMQLAADNLLAHAQGRALLTQVA
ncbi:MAG: D-glycerate dehydrogenase [Burkholderiaceae bacterium]|jgi:glyoxylate/hydroxypyruvate/2-ketogluconate reductase|nr:D-glycerate dehydrogenase [Burkholderiaceae bacterium]MDP4920307.1 D-glycerate dehydrogenase [Burkholderiaceae bacterium]